MTDVPGSPLLPLNFFPLFNNPWLNLPRPDAKAGAEPAAAEPPFSQPILPGWTFGNVVINTTNSTAPETEQRIVAERSYGRQIGILLDAMAALAKDPGAQYDDKTKAALKAVEDLETKVNEIKAEALKARVKRIEADLDTLRSKDDQADYDAAAAQLQSYLSEHPPGGGAKPGSTAKGKPN
jgi:hypothetical protein